MLRISLARELASPVLPSLKMTRPQHNEASILQKVFDGYVQNLGETLRLNSPATLHAAAKGLDKARRIVLFSMGLSYTVAYSLYSRLRFLGFPAFIELDSHMQLAAAAEMIPGEVAIGISVSGSTSETVECFRLAKARGAKTICITNSINSPLARIATISFYAAPSEMKYFQARLASRVTQLGIVDALLWAVSLRRKRKALTHLRRAAEQLLKRRIARP
jgi:DNA-binding MurR/RpiR family transcriptional regulator